MRFGIVTWLVVRLIALFYRLRTRFSGAPAFANGHAFEYRIQRSKGGTVCGAWIGISAPETLCFLFREERWLDRLGKSLGIAEEFQTGDEPFDSGIYIVSDDRTLLKALAADHELRKRVARLLDHKDVSELHCNRGYLWTEGAPRGPTTGKDPEVGASVGHEIAPLLSAVNERLQQINAAQWQDARDPNVINEQLFYIAAFILGLAGLVAYIIMPELKLPRPLLLTGADRLATITVAISFVALSAGAACLLRHSSRLHLVLMEILLTAVPGVWLLGRWGYAQQNMHLDTSPRRVYYLKVDRQFVKTGGKGRHDYFLVMDSWPDPRIDPTIRVDENVYGMTTVGSCLEIGYHLGRFSDPWIDSMQPLSSCRD